MNMVSSAILELKPSVRQREPVRLGPVGGFNPSFGFCSQLGFGRDGINSPASGTTTTTTTTTSTTTTTTTTAAATPPAVVQSAVANESAGDGIVSVSWPAPTTAGNTLVAVVGAQRSGTAGVPNFTPPASDGWVQAATSPCDSASGQDKRLSIYYIANASSQSGSKNWTCDTFMGVASIGVVILELSAVRTTTPLDVTQVAADTSIAATTATTGTTAASTVANSIAIAGLLGGSTLGSPASSFTIQNQTAGTVNVAALVKVLAATAAQSTSATYVTPGSAAGAIIVLKGN